LPSNHRAVCVTWDNPPPWATLSWPWFIYERSADWAGSVSSTCDRPGRVGELVARQGNALDVVGPNNGVLEGGLGSPTAKWTSGLTLLLPGRMFGFLPAPTSMSAPMKGLPWSLD